MQRVVCKWSDIYFWLPQFLKYAPKLKTDDICFHSGSKTHDRGRRFDCSCNGAEAEVTVILLYKRSREALQLKGARSLRQNTLAQSNLKVNLKVIYAQKSLSSKEISKGNLFEFPIYSKSKSVTSSPGISKFFLLKPN